MIWDDGTQFRKSGRSENLLRFPTYPIAVGRRILYIDFVEIAVFAAGQETGAGLGRGTLHFAVAADEGAREQALQADEQGQKLLTLLGGAGVAGMPLGIQSALIADAYAAAVVGTAVGTHLKQTAVLGDDAAAADVEVIAHGAESTPAMVAQQLLFGIVAIGACGRAVYHQPAHAVGLHHHQSGFHLAEVMPFGEDLVLSDDQWISVSDHNAFRFLQVFKRCP